MSQCTSAHALIDAFVAEGLSRADAATLSDHVRDCAACAARLRSVTRLADLLSSLPEVEPAPGFEARQFAAVLADRARRGEHRSWLSDLRVQIVRGMLRTTGTLAATITAVALLGAAFVLAASNLFSGIAQVVLPAPHTPHATAPLVAAAPTPAPTVSAVTITPTPTPQPTPVPTPRPTPIVTPTPVPATPTPQPTEQPTPTAAIPTPTATVQPAPTPTPEPSASAGKCRRSPYGYICYSPSPSPSATATRPSAAPTPATSAEPLASPSATPTSLP